MWLLNVNIPGRQGLHHIQVDGSAIKTVSTVYPSIPRGSKELYIDASNGLAFPGLINSHDHLDFNLFPPIGNKTYTSYVEWGSDIHANNRKEIDAITVIPAELRIRWGMYKNLLAGVTTVVNHGEKIPADNTLINVFEDCQVIHSVQRDKRWRWRLNNFRKKKMPVVIHIGEGTDDTSSREIESLLRWNFLHRPIIGVHGISMKEQQAARFKALIWCPVSNYFLYGETAAVEKLAHQTTLLFGTDSTLTGPWNFWEHLRAARESELVCDEQLFNMLTTQAARVWNLPGGRLEPGQQADIVIAKPTQAEGWDAFYNLNPEDLLLVMRGGTVRLFDEILFNSLQKADLPLQSYSRISIKGTIKYVEGDLPALMKAIQVYHPGVQFPVAV